jgi:hypothetical protein
MMDFIIDPCLALYLPLHELDGASFMSKDAGGHQCSVTGALWKLNGRWFDRQDDRIDCGSGSALQIATSVTWELWLNPDNLAPRQTIFSNTPYGLEVGSNISNIPAYTNTIGLVRHGVGDGCVAQNGALTTGWHHLVYVKREDGATNELYLDGLSLSLQSNQNFNWASSGTHYLGARGGASQWYGNLIGEARIYHRALTSPEIQQNYIATRWRYQ